LGDSDWRTVRDFSKRRRQIGEQGGNIPNGDVRLGDSEGTLNGGVRLGNREGIFQTFTSDWGTVREYSKRRRQIRGQ
jgi:hypothetical protein